jgi:trans-aconitate methyltransferase
MDYSDQYDPDTDFDAWYSHVAIDVVKEFIRPGDRVAELGCSTGLMTEVLAGRGAQVEGIEQSSIYLKRAEARNLQGVEWRCQNLDEWVPKNESYEHVVAANVLHEVGDPVQVLSRVRSGLVSGGLVHVTLQNPESIHRLAALDMGLIADLHQVSQRGEAYGTRSLWTVDEFIALARDCGLRCLFWRGLALKPFPNIEMERLAREVLEGLQAVSLRLSGISAMYYVLLARDTSE